MSFALFTTDGFQFLLRWLHYFFGIIWIGHLYYFNFTQGPFFAETDASTKSGAIQKLVPRALWWFRWGAMYTLITGLLILGVWGHVGGIEVFGTSRGINILVGAAFGILMWYNVWFVIWPNQKIVIANAVDTAQGKPANPAAAGAGARAGVASRHNVLFSVPMLFYMGGASHLPVAIENSPMTFAVAMAVIMLGLEFNALKGKTGPLTTVKGVITSGFVLAAVVYLLEEILL